MLTMPIVSRIFFHPELPVHVNKPADIPAYLKQLALERIGDIPIDAVQVYTDDSRDDYYRFGSGIYIKSQDHILRIQRRNPDGCSVFRSELIAIDEALVLLHLFQMEKRFGYCLIVEVQYSTCPIGKVAHQAGLSRRSLAGVGLFESVRRHGPGLALLTNGGGQQQQQY
ncbi:uncharacterized protein TNCV_3063341 [Trichonephila clavipes]|nr:uncharacterized protein TNCV_3063341 [Trichonephila clavipes]